MNEIENLREILSRLDQKIDNLETKIDKLQKKLSPPWWKSFAKFLVNNFFTILTLVSLLIIAWKAWEFYNDIYNQIENVRSSADSLRNISTGAKNSIRGFFEGLGF